MNTNVITKAKLVDTSADSCSIPCFNGELVRTLKGRMPDAEPLTDASRLFGALSDPTRLKLLLALHEGDELCVCDLAHVAGTSISTASHHLRKLRDVGVLKHRSDGRMTYYAIRDHRVGDLAMLMFSGPSDSAESSALPRQAAINRK